jgi:hypothetical protein
MLFKSNPILQRFFYKESEEIDLIQKPAILPKKDLENSLFRET